MYLTKRFYIVVAAIVLGLVAGEWWPWCYTAGIAALWLLVAAVALDVVLLYHRRAIVASRRMASRFSNGDDNEVTLSVASDYPFAVWLEVIDEIPHIFQRRDVLFGHRLAAHGACDIIYRLRPVKRGVYGFGHIRVFAATALGLVQRRYTLGSEQDVAVYPSYLMLNKYELLAMSDNLTELGIKRIRRVGNNTEFEQIKEYVEGDEYRAINWKASARRGQLMVNVYQDERSQQVFNVIDKGRVMQQAFKLCDDSDTSDRMTLLDYAINASLVLSYVATHKEDKAGIVTFAGDFGEYVPAERRASHMMVINEALYNLETDFDDSDFAALAVNIDRLIRRRSLLVLYTNFTSLDGMRRQLPYLRRMNMRHRLLVVFFDDVETAHYVSERPRDLRGYYTRVIAMRQLGLKRAIVAELRRNGIHSLLTSPSGLTINVINRYLEMKARHLF